MYATSECVHTSNHRHVSQSRNELPQVVLDVDMSLLVRSFGGYHLFLNLGSYMAATIHSAVYVCCVAA
jgi:hypothetical protein